ncbi:NADP oxidoreductase [Streptococcus oralis]|uniref:NADP oxidoreductase n=1 Tax=Streptococcus oralis TaxID=1303 RepID=A0A4V1QC04_STROR|nr:NADP oxidoreductase [Streptococcus oralis]
MLVYSGRVEGISTNTLNTAKTTTESYGLATDYFEGENIVDF